MTSLSSGYVVYNQDRIKNLDQHGKDGCANQSNKCEGECVVVRVQTHVHVLSIKPRIHPKISG